MVRALVVGSAEEPDAASRMGERTSAERMTDMVRGQLHSREAHRAGAKRAPIAPRARWRDCSSALGPPELAGKEGIQLLDAGQG